MCARSLALTCTILALLSPLFGAQKVLNVAEKDFDVDVPYRALDSDGKVLPRFEDFAPASALEAEERAQDRPSGPWEFVTAARVPGTPVVVWEDLQHFGSLVTNALFDLAVNFRPQDEDNEEWIVDLNNGEKLAFLITETNQESMHHIFIINNHTSDVFPSLNLIGSTLFVNLLEGSQPKTTIIDMGWGGPSIDGPKDVAITQMKGLLDRMASNLQRSYGEVCAFSRNIRHIEGDCVNLDKPSRGAAGQPLKRLPIHDPAFPDGIGLIPAGATDVSPRLISNLVFQQSPGIEILAPILKELKGQCAKTKMKGIVWRICPFSRARASRRRKVLHKLKWAGTTSQADSSLVMHFNGSSCNLDVIFACNGKIALDLAPEPCSTGTNRFYHPSACVIPPGEDGVLQNSAGLTDMFWSFGQFVDHDLDLTPVSQLAETAQPGFSVSSTQAFNKDQFPIPVPSDDGFVKDKLLEFERSIFSQRDDAQSHINQHSSYLDLGQVYGVDNMRARVLRSYVDGKLRTSAGQFPPFNKIRGSGALRAKVENAPNAAERYYVVGDIRGNEQSTLLSLHILFLREHNLVCDELKTLFPDWDDVKLYQVARAITVSAYQSIIYTEWLPKLVGEGVVTSRDGFFDKDVDPTISAVFSTSSFRFGHSMVGSFLWLLGEGPRELASLELIPLRVAFFNPGLVKSQGIDRFIRGAAWHPAKEVDVKVVDELRNFLFARQTDRAHMDLVALNIQRGRDMGLPSHNQVRDALGLTTYESFSEITSDPMLARVLNKVYKGDVEKLDTFVGGLAEDHKNSSILGSTNHMIIADQFRRIRDGDRFFYNLLDWDQNVLDAYPRLSKILADEVKLHDIIMRNTDITRDELGEKPSVFSLS